MGGDECKVSTYSKEYTQALSSPTCLVDNIWHVNDWPERKKMADVYTPAVMRQLAPRIKKFCVALNPKITGRVPDELWDCKEMTDLRLCQTSLTGDLTKIGQLTKLEIYIGWGTEFSG